MKPAKSKKLAVDMSEQEILQKLLADKVKSIDPNFVFQGIMGQDGQISYKLAGKKINPNQLATLRTEAQVFEKMQLYKIITETLRNQAHIKLFEKMNSLDDSHYGKAMLASILVVETIVSNIEKAQTQEHVPHNYAQGQKLSTDKN